MTDERRERWETQFRQYDAHEFRDLATIGMGIADKEQTALQARVADLEEQVIAMGGHQAAAEEHAATIGRVRAALDYCDRGSAIAIRAALDGEEA